MSILGVRDNYTVIIAIKNGQHDHILNGSFLHNFRFAENVSSSGIGREPYHEVRDKITCFKWRKHGRTYNKTSTKYKLHLKCELIYMLCVEKFSSYLFELLIYLLHFHQSSV